MAIYRSPSLGSQLLLPLSHHLLGHGLLLFCFSVPFEYSPWAQNISCPSLLKLLHSSSAKYRHGLQGGRHMFVNFILVLLTIIHTWRCKKPLLSNYIKPQLHGWFHQKALMDRKKHKHIYRCIADNAWNRTKTRHKVFPTRHEPTAFSRLLPAGKSVPGTNSFRAHTKELQKHLYVNFPSGISSPKIFDQILFYCGAANIWHCDGGNGICGLGWRRRTGTVWLGCVSVPSFSTTYCPTTFRISRLLQDMLKSARRTTARCI